MDKIKYEGKMIDHPLRPLCKSKEFRRTLYRDVLLLLLKV